MTDAPKLMAEVTELHQFIHCNHSSIGPEDHCSCGHRPYGWIQYAGHLAAEIDKALGGLTQEHRTLNNSWVSWVSGWTEVTE